MSHDLSLAQSHAFQLARTLMVPVTLFQVDGEFGVMPSDELDDADVIVVHDYDPFEIMEKLELNCQFPGRDHPAGTTHNQMLCRNAMSRSGGRYRV
ncbi:hypothetical protein ACI7BZ_21175 [Xanthobacter sp. AM11]|uniref:hypothetical protein n=1 Tax=Xanthobacter sp. AM11 TaxID=3380643 RepID=UPI0039BF79CC